MLYRVSFWNDRTDEEVYGKTIRANDENEAEEIFFDTLLEKNDYSEDLPVLVREENDLPTSLDFENLFCRALTAVVEKDGGSISEALDDIGIGEDTAVGKSIKIWYGWDDDECIEDDDRSELPWDYGKHFE